MLVEKPLATTSEEARELINYAERNWLILMVDHTFIYTDAVRKLKKLVYNNIIGDILYFDSVRINLGLFQQDTNVVWDLAAHDISIMNYLINKEPLAVSAVGMNHYSDFENIAYITVCFVDKLIAHFHINWLSPVKIRRILLTGSKQMVVYDDLEPNEKIKVYDKGVEIKKKDSIPQTLVKYRIGNMYAPHIDQTEPLSLVTNEFITCIQTGKQPLTDGKSALDVVKILEAADLSLKENGIPIKLQKI